MGRIGLPTSWSTRGGVEDALELAAETIKDAGFAGLFCTEEVNEDYKQAIAEGKTEEEAQEYAEMDRTYTESGWIDSDEWFLEENPDRARLLAIRQESRR